MGGAAFGVSLLAAVLVFLSFAGFSESSTTVPPDTNCTCQALFVKAPAVSKRIVGIYHRYECLIAGREVYEHNGGSHYLLYNESSSTWVFSSLPDVSGVSYVESIESNATLPFEVAGTWNVDFAGTWTPSPAVSVECICGQTVIRENVTIKSTDEANTFFPGTFTFYSEYNDRPAYYNSQDDVYLYFHSRADCHMWAVAAKLDANQWLMFSYDISPVPNQVVAPWSVARSSGWVDDDTMTVVCI